MKIYPLNCGTLCPVAASLSVGSSHMVCRCLLIETSQGLVLVDTGLGSQDIQNPSSRLGRLFMTLVRPKLDPEETARWQIERLGFKVEEVRHIVLTHLDLDHAGGIGDFPKAQVHVLKSEYQEAMTTKRHGYRPIQWASQPQWLCHPSEGEAWFGFQSVQALDRLSEILLIPLPGHSRGHCGVAIKTGPTWILHAGDAFFHHKEISENQAQCPIGLRFFQNIVQWNREKRLENQERLRELKREQRMKIFCSHDPFDFFDVPETSTHSIHFTV
ncbi:MAG: MBL fold metallo-hydrolase [Deltaproteobacteria bacterium]|nr:MBL fold metallo-hydrolase [Deltaproteobacteria bacterium]